MSEEGLFYSFNLSSFLNRNWKKKTRNITSKIFHLPSFSFSLSLSVNSKSIRINSQWIKLWFLQRLFNFLAHNSLLYRVANFLDPLYKFVYKLKRFNRGSEKNWTCKRRPIVRKGETNLPFPRKTGKGEEGVESESTSKIKKKAESKW